MYYKIPTLTLLHLYCVTDHLFILMGPYLRTNSSDSTFALHSQRALSVKGLFVLNNKESSIRQNEGRSRLDAMCSVNCVFYSCQGITEYLIDLF